MANGRIEAGKTVANGIKKLFGFSAKPAAKIGTGLAADEVFLDGALRNSAKFLGNSFSAVKDLIGAPATIAASLLTVVAGNNLIRNPSMQSLAVATAVGGLAFGLTTEPVQNAIASLTSGTPGLKA